jgi:hypothetical protein
MKAGAKCEKKNTMLMKRIWIQVSGIINKNWLLQIARNKLDIVNQKYKLKSEDFWMDHGLLMMNIEMNVNETINRWIKMMKNNPNIDGSIKNCIQNHCQ